MTKCTICKKQIDVEQDGCYNLPSGVECIKCHEQPKKKIKFVNIAGYKIPYQKLYEYAEVVEYTRRAALRGQTTDDPEIVMRALANRVKIHKEIFKIAGIDHDSIEPKAMKVRRALEIWLEKNVITKPQVNNLV